MFLPKVLKRLTDVLRQCTRDPSLPAPLRVLKTSWVTHPFHLGSYSYGAMETVSPRHQEALAEPLVGPSGKPEVLFAGEATHETAYSTVHGARASGIRVAVKLLSGGAI